MPRVRIGIDVGGTFTDVYLYEELTGKLAVHKLPTTTGDPSEGIIDGAVEILRQCGLPVADITYFAHGSTIATNALIQHRGAKTGLITTAGFRDLLEIGRQSRPDLYDLQADKPEPLVTRDLRLEARERLYYDGSVATPLNLNDVHRAIERLLRAKVEAVAICFLHGYVNPVSESAAASLVREQMPGVFCSVSHEVLPEFREFERLNTTVVNAYLGPIVERYVQNLKRKVGELGIGCKPYMTQSNGGVISLDTAAVSPARIVLSGPSTGVIGAASVCREAGHDNVITFDMGGTSTDVSLITRGKPNLTSQRELGGYPVKTPMIDVHSIGAGGGSIAWVDRGGLLKVGPESAGAIPGPACYQKGGVDATVTDAAVALGLLNPEHLLGGRMKIDRRLAFEAVERLSGQLGLDIYSTAQGILDIVVANMVRAARVISVQRGYDPRSYTLCGFGGAGPLFAGPVARDLHMQRILIPERPGLLCAFGLQVTDMRTDFLRTSIMPATPEGLGALNAGFDDLEKQAGAWLDEEAIPRPRRRFTRYIDMRYQGQNYELRVPVPGGRLNSEAFDRILKAFYRLHDQTYGYAVEGEPAQFVTMRVEARGLISKVPLPRYEPAGPEPKKSALLDFRQVRWHGGLLDCPIYERTLLEPGNILDGPALVEQMDTTSWILPGQRCEVDLFRNLIIEDRGE